MFIGKHNRLTAAKGPETEPEVAQGETSGRWREKWSERRGVSVLFFLFTYSLKADVSYMLALICEALQQGRPEWLKYAQKLC